VLPFGLNNAPAFSIGLMNRLFKPFLNKFMVLFINDILVYSETKGEHADHMRIELEALEEHKL